MSGVKLDIRPFKFFKSEKMSGQTVQPIKIKIVPLFYLIKAEIFVYLLLCFGHIQSKNKVTLLKALFQNREDRGEKISADQDTKATTFNLILAAQASNFYHGFCNALDIFSPKIKTIS